jgi:hypothetical protein
MADKSQKAERLKKDMKRDMQKETQFRFSGAV